MKIEKSLADIYSRTEDKYVILYILAIILENVIIIIIINSEIVRDLMVYIHLIR